MINFVNTTTVDKEEYNTELYWWNDKVLLEMAYKQETQWSVPLDLTSVFLELMFQNSVNRFHKYFSIT